MKFKRFASASLLSVALLGGVTAEVINPTFAQASPSFQAQLANKTIISSSDFVTVDRGHATTGSAKIISENGQRYLEFSEGFKTGSGPDVQIILHRSEVVPVNVNEQDYVILTSLQSFNGKQRYAIPADLNLNEFSSVAIWCRRFNITFGYAGLAGS